MLLCVMASQPLHAQTSEAIQVISSSARPDFPNEIVFALEATSSAAAISTVQLLYGPTRSEAALIVDLEPPAQPQVRLEHRLDTQVYYYPPGTEMSYRWLIRDADGNSIETPVQQFVYTDERFGWQERTVGEVTIFWYAGGDAFGDAVAGTVEQTLSNLSNTLKASLRAPVRIYIYASIPDMYSALQANSAEWIGGQANTGLGVIVAAIAPDNEREIRRMIPHELSHQVLHQHIENPYGNLPRWLDEGLAVHHQEVRDREYDQLLIEAAQENRLIPLEALASSFPADPDQAQLSYAQSRSIVEYILDTYGEEPLQTMIMAFAEATPVEEAVQSALGMSVDELDAAWRSELPAATMPAPDLSGPQVAPQDRFRDPPVLPVGAINPVPTPTPAPTTLGDRVAALPAWVTLGGSALFCLTGVVLLAVVLLVALRRIGVDKRN
ncbi:peptidase MA family metallohydrolase [Candidatus Oscillochloris fontis]|uniref:peptidase MA family metallohydrolase n=1 Tax=Candidatus Oscillochloris fontis TaxID=2496868 RepID=UPI001375A46C|nr:peptidase MA family metallohydrolase [Candidatus Oscillochloris fontis]